MYVPWIIVLTTILFLMSNEAFAFYHQRTPKNYTKQRNITILKRSGSKIEKEFVEPFEPVVMQRSGHSIVSGSTPTLKPLIPGPKKQNRLNTPSVFPSIEFDITKKQFDSEKKHYNRDVFRAGRYMTMK